MLTSGTLEEKETRHVETFHRNPVSERISLGKAWPAAGSEPCVLEGDNPPREASPAVRLITAIHLNRGKVYIRYILTHKEYDTGDWKTQN